MSIFDRMAAARAQALVLNQHTIGWKMNRVALAALRQEGAFDEKEAAGADEKLSLFGLPIIVETEDRSPQPLFWLIAEILEQKDVSTH